MSARKTSRNLARPLLIAALMAPLLLAACGKKESESSMPSGSAAQPTSPPMSSPAPATPSAPTPPATSTPPAGESTSTPPSAPATGSEPAK